MQTTFVLTIVIGAPLVAALSIPFTLPTWGSRLEFAIRVGAVVWILIAVPVFLYAEFVLEGGADEGAGGSTTPSDSASKPLPDEMSADQDESS
nr:DUF5822 domain-containing protein [Natranaeroarchaeum aerophilus]